MLGYSNGCVMYLPRAQDYPPGGWDVHVRYKIPDMLFQNYLVPVAFQPDSEQRVVATALNLLNELDGAGCTVSGPGQQVAARAALDEASRALNVTPPDLTVVEVRRRRRANTKVPFYYVTFQLATGTRLRYQVSDDGRRVEPEP